jgi:ribosomal protein S6
MLGFMINDLDIQGEATTDKMTVYELSYLLLPSFSEAESAQKAGALKETVSSLGGAVISDENPVLIDLAYQMTKVVGTIRHKESRGHFGWVKFEMTPSGIEALKKNLDLDQDILRYLIVKTVRENTLLNGKIRLQKEEKGKKDEEVLVEAPEVPKESVPEEIDKSIDELVIV